MPTCSVIVPSSIRRFFWDGPEAVLVDTAFPGTAGQIVDEVRKSCAASFSIVVTHQDIDHIGGGEAIVAALDRDVRIFAHELDAPYIRGEKLILKLAALGDAGTSAAIHPRRNTGRKEKRLSRRAPKTSGAARYRRTRGFRAIPPARRPRRLSYSRPYAGPYLPFSRSFRHARGRRPLLRRERRAPSLRPCALFRPRTKLRVGFVACLGLTRSGHQADRLLSRRRPGMRLSRRGF